MFCNVIKINSTEILNRVIIAGTVIAMILTGTCLYYNLRRIYLYLRQRYYGDSVSVPSEFESEERSIKVSFQD